MTAAPGPSRWRAARADDWSPGASGRSPLPHSAQGAATPLAGSRYARTGGLAGSHGIAPERRFLARGQASSHSAKWISPKSTRAARSGGLWASRRPAIMICSATNSRPPSSSCLPMRRSASSLACRNPDHMRSGYRNVQVPESYQRVKGSAASVSYNPWPEAYVQDDHFSQSLEMLDNGCLPDPAVDAEDARLMLAQQYAYVFPGDSTLAMLAALGPLVEIGAGTGYWACRLRSIGVDIVAFDQAPVDGERANRYHSPTRPWTHVEQGDQTVLSGYADRGLFLCWPPLFSSLGDCLTYYRGDTVAYIGDGGYRTARLDGVHEAFTKVATDPVRALDPHPGAGPSSRSGNERQACKRRASHVPRQGCSRPTGSAVGRAGNHPTWHRGLLIEVIARANAVVAVSDPQGDPMHQ